MPHRQSIDHASCGIVGVDPPATPPKLRRASTVRTIPDEHCRTCDEFPCLADKACTHVDILHMAETLCPLGKWDDPLDLAPHGTTLRT